MLVGALFCAAFVTFSFLAREQPDSGYVLVKADRLVRTAGTPLAARQTVRRTPQHGNRKPGPGLFCLNLEPLTET